MSYVYTAWLQDPLAAEDDPDREWPACFVVRSTDQAAAKAWGDHLAHDYCARKGQKFLYSLIEPTPLPSPTEVDALPAVAVGDHATDEEIGW